METGNLPRVADIRSRAMLATCQFSFYKGQKFDRRASAELTASKHAASDAARVNVHTLTRDDLSEVSTIFSQVKNGIWYRLTAPWASTQVRILPCVHHDELKIGIEDAQHKLSPALDRLEDRWQEIVEKNRGRLGDLFDASAFPESISDRYAIRFRVMPIPAAADFRVDMDSDQVERLKESYETSYREALDGATRDSLVRVLKPLTDLAERLAKYRIVIQADGKRRIENEFRDTGFKQLAKVVEVLPALNLTGNPDVARMIDRVGAIARRDPAALRASVRERREAVAEISSIASEVDQILATMGGAPMEFGQDFDAAA